MKKDYRGIELVGGTESLKKDICRWKQKEKQMTIELTLPQAEVILKFRRSCTCNWTECTILFI
jgi:hypothetical protein